MLVQAAAEDVKAIMLYDDPQLARLNDASHIITSGSLPTWMKESEVQQLLHQLLPAAQKAGKAKDLHEQLEFLGHKVHENIHVIVCAGSGDSGLAKFYQNFPGECWTWTSSFGKIGKKPLTWHRCSLSTAVMQYLHMHTPITAQCSRHCCCLRNTNSNNNHLLTPLQWC